MSVGRPVDLAHLSRYTGGDAAINAEVLTLFAGQTIVLLARLDTALAERIPKFGGIRPMG